jgi:hypothetical protein
MKRMLMVVVFVTFLVASATSKSSSVSRSSFHTGRTTLGDLTALRGEEGRKGKGEVASLSRSASANVDVDAVFDVSRGGAAKKDWHHGHGKKQLHLMSSPVLFLNIMAGKCSFSCLASGPAFLLRFTKRGGGMKRAMILFFTFPFCSAFFLPFSLSISLSSFHFLSLQISALTACSLLPSVLPLVKSEQASVALSLHSSSS